MTCNVPQAPEAGNIPVTDAMIGPLASNGGPTRTHALLTGSPAIGAGAACLADDQRSLLRGAVCDIGAFEFGPSPAWSAAHLRRPRSSLSSRSSRRRWPASR